MQKKTQNKKLPSVHWIGLTVLAFAVTGFLVGAKPVVLDAELETCADCHDEYVSEFMANPHIAIQENSCTSCHGSAETHLDEGGGANIFAFKSEDIPKEKSSQCLTCHTHSNARYMVSPHGRANMDCTSCHSVHTKDIKADATKSCYSCHEDVFSEFQLNERHRLQEGIMNCTTCHNPHEPSTRQRLGGFKNESCFKCHTDKSGPYLYEHGASRIEGCSSCHNVHGSPNRHMLNQQSVSDLCFSCHTTAVSWHARFDSSTNCVVCHATIHGSNLSNRFLK